MTFDAWEVEIGLSEDCLAHHGIPGMKHGRRRYQNEDGTWTEVGLAERRKREGFGERRAERKAARAERRSARKEARRKAFRQFAEKRRQNSIKNLSDEELQARINRLKMEKEYKELNKNPAVEAGMKLVSNYFKAKEEKLAREERRYKMETDRANARANLVKAQAQKTEARNEFIDSLKINSKGKLKARAEFLKAKDQRSKNTIRGAISSSIGSIIRKEGSRTVKDMGGTSLTMRSGRFIKRNAKKSYAAVKREVQAIRDGVAEGYAQGKAEAQNRAYEYRYANEQREARKRLRR